MNVSELFSSAKVLRKNHNLVALCDFGIHFFTYYDFTPIIVAYDGFMR